MSPEADFTATGPRARTALPWALLRIQPGLTPATGQSTPHPLTCLFYATVLAGMGTSVSQRMILGFTEMGMRGYVCTDGSLQNRGNACSQRENFAKTMPGTKGEQVAETSMGGL